MPTIRKSIGDLFQRIRWLTDTTLTARVLYLILPVTSLLMLVPLLHVGSPKFMIPLSGEWKISLEDAPEFARYDYDDRAWGAISLPGKVISHAVEKTGKHKGVCWLRKIVFIQESEEEWGLILGRIANADETYLNGYKIGGLGQFAPHEQSWWNHPRNYPLPDSWIKKGADNVIAVRVSYNIWGEILGKLMLTDIDYMKRYDVFSRFVNVSVPYIAIGLGVIISITYLLSHMKKFYFTGVNAYFLQLFVGLPLLLELCLTWRLYGDPLLRLKILGLSWVAVYVLHPMFLHRLYHLKRTWVEVFLWKHLLVCTVGAFLFTNAHNLRWMSLLLIGTTWCIGFYVLWCHIEALLHKRDYARLFSPFGIALVIAAMHDGWIYFNKFLNFDISLPGYTPTHMVIQFGTLFLYLGTSLILEVKYKDALDEVSDLNTNLETIIIENAQLNERLLLSEPRIRPAPITPRSEEKLLAAIDIIKDNYLDELSRSDIARSVGVHPDSLGKQFKQYTGKKLGDYIYELRIGEAAKRLRETDDNVIDIAFAVGFESLRTFNRVFPKFMNTTPDQYRKQHQGT